VAVGRVDRLRNGVDFGGCRQSRRRNSGTSH
jgi:hypothetical protein